MKHRIAFAVTIVFVVAALAYSRPETLVSPGLKIKVEDKNPWTHLGLNNRPENFQFAIVTDRTGGHRPGVFESAVGKLNLMQPEFVMSVGDLIEGDVEGVKGTMADWREFKQFVRRLEMPFFYVPGNHDLRNLESISLWQSQFGRTYFHFVYQNVLFIALNSEDPPATKDRKLGNISDEQFAWFKKVLADNSGVDWTILFLHRPMWQYGPMSNWGRMEKALGDRPRTAFAGHHHKYAVAQVGDYTYYTLATTGGASKLLGPAEGSFDHVTWITMTPKGPRLANLLLNGILTDDPMTEARENERTQQTPQPAGAATK